MPSIVSEIDGQTAKNLDILLARAVKYAKEESGAIEWHKKNVNYDYIVNLVFAGDWDEATRSYHRQLLYNSRIVLITGNPPIFQVNESVRQFLQSGGFTSQLNQYHKDNQNKKERDQLELEHIKTNIKRNKSTIWANKWAVWSIVINIILVIINLLIAKGVL